MRQSSPAAAPLLATAASALSRQGQHLCMVHTPCYLSRGATTLNQNYACVQDSPQRYNSKVCVSSAF